MKFLTVLNGNCTKTGRIRFCLNAILVVGLVWVVLCSPTSATTFIWSKDGTVEVVGNSGNSSVILTPTGMGKVLPDDFVTIRHDVIGSRHALQLCPEDELVLGGRVVRLATNTTLEVTFNGTALVDGTVNGVKLEDGTVSGEKLADGTVGGTKLEDFAVGIQKVADGAISTEKLGDGAVTTEKMMDGAVTERKLSNESITTAKLKEGVVTTEKLGEGSVTNGKLNNTSVTTEKVQDESITTKKLKEGAVTTGKIMSSAVTTEKIMNGAVTEEKVQDRAIAGEKIKDEAITGDKIKNGTITGEKLQNGAVSAEKILDGAVTTNKLSDSAVNTDKLVGGAVTTEKLEDASVTTTKLANGSITESKLGDGAVTTEKLEDGAVTTEKLEDGAVTVNKLAEAAITGTKIQDGGISGSKLQNGSVTRQQIDPSQVQRRIVGQCIEGSIRSVHADGSVECSVPSPSCPYAAPTIRTFNVSADEGVVAGSAVSISAATGTVSMGIGIGRTWQLVNMGISVEFIFSSTSLDDGCTTILYFRNVTDQAGYFIQAVQLVNDSIVVGAPYELEELHNPVYAVCGLTNTSFVVTGTQAQLLGGDSYSMRLFARVCEVDNREISCGGEAVLRDYPNHVLSEFYPNVAWAGEGSMMYGKELWKLDEERFIVLFTVGSSVYRTFHRAFGTVSMLSVTFAGDEVLVGSFEHMRVLSPDKIVGCGQQNCSIGTIQGTGITFSPKTFNRKWWLRGPLIPLSECTLLGAHFDYGGTVAKLLVNGQEEIAVDFFADCGEKKVKWIQTIDQSRFMAYEESTSSLRLVSILSDGFAVGPSISGGDWFCWFLILRNSTRFIQAKAGDDKGELVPFLIGDIRPGTSLVGIATSSAPPGGSVEVVLSGISSGHFGLTPGTRYYSLPSGEVVPETDLRVVTNIANAYEAWNHPALKSTDNLWTRRAPLTDWNPVPYVGIAVSPTELMVSLGT